MKNIYLCGQTGSANRGCEAIVRSTVKLLGCRSGDVNLVTSAPEQDLPLTKSLGINLISYNRHPTKFHRYLYAGIRKFNKKSLAGQKKIQAPIFSRIKKGDISLNIGGDTYCYSRPLMSIALNKFLYKKNIDSVLWCCSVEPSVIKGEILDDLKRYKYIFAREIITYNALIESGIPKENVIKCCDPAFFLDKKEVELPHGFVIGNTVGINVSGVTMKNTNPQAYSNVVALVKYIIEKTDMSICLIPHVFSKNESTSDRGILKSIKSKFDNERISIVEEEYNCEELKYIISNCRFFVGARTHSTIAAYSSAVPTLVIGYSVKSKGISTDLFGTYEGYVLPYNELTEKNELIAAFISMCENEATIKDRLTSFLPKYKKSLTDAIAKYIIHSNDNDDTFNICRKELCTGCGACSEKCPVKCIEMKRDKEGFLYPDISYEKCINCGLCKKICPVANRNKDSGKEPDCYAFSAKNDILLNNSSSGGVFGLLAESIIERGGVVFGAGFDEKFRVVHKYTETIEGITDLQRSKYVQSDTGNSYSIAKQFLDAGRLVLFSGTPCQIGGLYATLGKSYDNLFTADFICHAVPSPQIYENYLEYRKEKAGSEIDSVSFRDKSEGWKNFSMKIEFKNSTFYRKNVCEDSYLKGFVADLYSRPSCSNCAFKLVGRESDLTLADFWGVEKYTDSFCDNRGTSLVILHSEKGKTAFSDIMKYGKTATVGFDAVLKCNKSYVKSVEASPLRPAFFKNIKKKNHDKLIKKYLGKSLFAKLRRKKAEIFKA